MSAHAGAEVVSFGCRLNLFESEVIRRLAREAGLDDTVIVNTCAVTAEAERQARQAIRRLKRAYPKTAIVVTGCAAQINPQSFAAMPEVGHVLGNLEKLDPARWRAIASRNGAAPRVQVADIMAVRASAQHLVSGFDGQTRAFLEVQQGCDHRCTFCIIPYARGPSRSVPIGALVARVRALVANGYREVVLTGVDLTHYGGDLPGRPRLGQMARRLLAMVPELPRLRLSSLDPAEIDDDIWRLLAEEPRFMPHLHLSLQSGDDLILKRMKRRHTRAQALAVSMRARSLRPDVALGGDLIAGFPTESEAMAENSRTLIDQAGLVYLHVFPFSPRPGTPAARMPQVPGDVRRARAAALRATGADALGRHLRQQIGRRIAVVVERSGLAGHAADFASVRLDRRASPGAIVAAEVIAADDVTLQARLVTRETFA
jgi:threonylcarbamoyladenosine tRNA methylthiotransferase MtaB